MEFWLVSYVEFEVNLYLKLSELVILHLFKVDFVFLLLLISFTKHTIWFPSHLYLMLIILQNGSRNFTIYTHYSMQHFNFSSNPKTAYLGQTFKKPQDFNLVFIFLICPNHMFLNRKCVDIKLTEFWCVNILNLFSCFDVATQKIISYVHIFKIFSFYLVSKLWPGEAGS